MLDLRVGPGGMAPADLCLHQVEVEFPNGPRNVEAEYVDHDAFRFGEEKPAASIRTLTPVDMPGWLFQQMVGGKWIAIQVPR